MSWLRTAQNGDTATLCLSLRYRYLLTRGDAPPTLGVIMLNPSTADELEDDATIRKLRGFALRWGYKRIMVANLYAYRATDPKELAKASDPVGPRNEEYLERVLRCDYVVAAWGANPFAKKREAYICDLADRWGTWLHCFRETSKGAPEHPLYIPYAKGPTVWRAPHAINGVRVVGAPRELPAALPIARVVKW